MNLKAVRGKNQFGYSFVSDPKLVLASDTVAISHGTRIVYSILRISQNVPIDDIIIDYRLFDELECNEKAEVNIRPISENFPMCGNITLSLASMVGLDNEKVAEAVSKRIEDLKPYLDGLILREGQIIQLPNLKLKFIVTHLDPSADFDRTARISWINLLRIHINPIKSSQCYNLILVLDLSTISDRSEIHFDVHHNEDEFPRLKVLTQIFSALLENLAHCKETSLFSSIAYSNQFTIFQTFDKTTGMQMNYNYFDVFSLIDAHENWLLQQLNTEIDAVSNPGSALKKALELANVIHEKNSLSTIICLISDGTYSSGQNPVKLVRLSTEPEIGVFCIALGDAADIEFLTAIAEAGGGEIISIRSLEDIAQISHVLNRWMNMR
jgi:hypothetical protein